MIDLWNKVDYLENHSRLNNINIIGLKEGKEAGCKMNEYILKILSEGLRRIGPEFEIERSHWNLGPKPNDDQSPRVILVKFLRFEASEKVLAKAKKNKGLDWEECKLSFFEDMSRERAMKRKTISTAKLLWDRCVCHILAHPAVLKFTWKGEKAKFCRSF